MLVWLESVWVWLKVCVPNVCVVWCGSNECECDFNCVGVPRLFGLQHVAEMAQAAEDVATARRARIAADDAAAAMQLRHEQLQALVVDMKEGRAGAKMVDWHQRTCLRVCDLTPPRGATTDFTARAVVVQAWWMRGWPSCS